MIPELIQRQKEAVDHFFDNINPDVIQNIVTRIVQKRKEGNTIFWSGIGKSFNIALHCADMLKSMGFASFAIKPIEALHGDIGAIRPGDMIFVFSKSGNTQELLSFMIHLSKMDTEIYGVFCNDTAKLAKYCHQVIVLPCGKELDNDFDLVPTTSVVSFILFCNLLVSFYLKSENVDIYQYGINHPSGNIGQRVWLSVEDIMYPLQDICIVPETSTLLDCMLAMTSCRTGYAVIVDGNDNKYIKGMISDGDIRRFMTQLTENSGNGDVDLRVSVTPLINNTPTVAEEGEKVRELVERVNKDPRLGVGMPVVSKFGDLMGFIDNKLLVKYGNIF